MEIKKEYIVFVCIGIACVGIVKMFTPSKQEPINIIRFEDSCLDTGGGILARLSQNNAFENPQKMCNKIKLIPETMHISVILNTAGGCAASCEKILRKLKNHKAGYTAFIKNECFSAGTIIALGASSIVMTKESRLGKIDPQLSTGMIGETYSAIDYYNLPETCISGANIGRIKQSIASINYIKSILSEIYGDNNSLQVEVEKTFIFSEFPHCKTFSMEECKAIGINVRSPTKEEMHIFE